MNTLIQQPATAPASTPAPLEHEFRGSRLQPLCRSLGIRFAELGHWVKNSSRHYPDRWQVLGVKVTAEGLDQLRAHFAAKEAKAAKARAKREHLAAHPEEAQAAADKRAATAAKREAREADAIRASVTKRWTLCPQDLADFIAHANEPGTGRVLRTKTACTEDFDTKVRMALVAWVRHNKTGYEEALGAAKDEAYRDYRSLKEEGYDADYYDNSSGEYLTASDARNAALEDARTAASEAHASLQPQYTAEAVQWLAQFEVPAK